MSAGAPRWGWHPLRRAWARRIVAASGVAAGQLVWDLGAGEGALTGPLLARGCRVVAVELHPRRAEALRRGFPDATVLRADLAALVWPRRPFTVVANPPYAGVNALARRLAHVSSLRAAHLVVAEGAARGLAERLGAELGMRVPPCAFVNPPPRSARLITLRPHG